MTTGSYTHGVYTGGYAAGNNFYEHKVWSGANGKYSSPGRTSWNNYSMSGIRGFQSGSVYNQWINIDCYSTPLDMTNFSLTLSTKLASALRQHDFMLGNFLAEGHQTIRMVTDTVGKLVSCVSHLKRGRIDLAARSLGTTAPHRYGRGHNPLVAKDVGNYWLELQYGWRPLLSDVFEAGKAFHHLTQTNKQTYGRVKHAVSASRTVVNLDSFDYSNTRKYGQSIIYRLDSPISAPSSLGLTDPLSVAWEVIPYSFVADWFFPIGDYLDAVHTVNSVAGLYLTTERTEDITRCFCNRTKVPSGYPNEYRGVVVNARRVTLNRNVSSNFSVPPPQWKGFGLSTGHMWNSLALLSQHLGK